ncbi:hypothetical protein M2105_004505 [Paenibacillus sp. PastF-1]|nr:hypothetical protein [Paenibacillus sp. PastF-2]MDF9849923.1 hypothetical protein [Paenibacillus sp. PastM-2]MDF9856631.1 hypothetical protein [Paenibacillus sp. PastF-1]MDH6481900.1 hypothetical protein [Paenibacillus sp. PastH-2]MDH6509326.1 hypothetical protein [Paenibacillus sp. PastM-3]
MKVAEAYTFLLCTHGPLSISIKNETAALSIRTLQPFLCIDGSVRGS